ncbi:MAG: flagellar brake protein [Candidatus Zixiibacteriota bacterium]
MAFALAQLNDPIAVWEKLHIVMGTGPDAGHYLARVEDITEREIIVGNPEYVKGSTLLRDNATVSVLLTRRDAVYKFTTRIKRHAEGKRIEFHIGLPTDLQRVQRREYVRIELLEQLSYSRLSDLAPVEKNSPMNWHRTTTVDISAGGVLIKLVGSMASGDLVLLRSDLFARLSFPDTLLGICRRICKDRDVTQGGIEFITKEAMSRFAGKALVDSLPKSVQQFDKQVQMRLEQYVFKRQISLRQKGLL